MVAVFLALVSAMVGFWVMSNLSKEGSGRQRSAAVDYNDWEN
jgi:hypothetical protein